MIFKTKGRSEWFILVWQIWMHWWHNRLQIIIKDLKNTFKNCFIIFFVLLFDVYVYFSSFVLLVFQPIRKLAFCHMTSSTNQNVERRKITKSFSYGKISKYDAYTTETSINNNAFYHMDDKFAKKWKRTFFYRHLART